MRTVVFLLVGLLLLAACSLLGRLFETNYPNAAYTATAVYLSLWLLVSAFNLWTGVSKAGYSIADELPIFLLIFGVPAAAAVLLKWRFL